MKNNYPIKYALMPLYEKTGWIRGLNELEREYNVVFYVVSKCYVLGERKKYNIDGNFHIDYEIVFPYKRDNIQNKEWIRTEPQFNFDYESTNSVIVNKVFDDYSDALNEANLLNKKIRDLSSNDITQKYKDLEIKIEENTKDLKMNEISKQQTIIVMFEDKDIVCNMSLYNFIVLYCSDYFYVCNVSQADYDLMKNQIKNNGRLDERCSKESMKLKYDRFRYLLANDPKENIVRIANCDSKKEIGCFYLSNDNMYYDEKMYQFYKDPIFQKNIHGIKVYTTETYEDIIKSYIPRYISNSEIEIDNIVVRKKLVLK